MSFTLSTPRLFLSFFNFKYLPLPAWGVDVLGCDLCSTGSYGLGLAVNERGKYCYKDDDDDADDDDDDDDDDDNKDKKTMMIMMTTTTMTMMKMMMTTTTTLLLKIMTMMMTAL
jgi:hypothetical protein